MREEYDFSKAEARRNPYAKRLKKQITINIDNETIDFFKEQSENSGIPYQTLINLYLADCVKQKKTVTDVLEIGGEKSLPIYLSVNPSKFGKNDSWYFFRTLVGER